MAYGSGYILLTLRVTDTFAEGLTPILVCRVAFWPEFQAVQLSVTLHERSALD